jgi:hypothetical protein
MALGGESGFAAGYTPIRFAPLVSLTGPIQGPATPTAPEAPAALQAPMLKLPQESGYEVLGNPLFEGDPIGTRMSTPAGRQAELANLANAAGFLTSPFSAMANYVLTGRSPAEMFGVGDFRAAQGPAQQGLLAQGQGIFGNVRDFLSGLMSQGGQPAGAPAQQGFSPEMGFSVANDAYQMALSSGADEQAAMNAANSAASLVAQGMDPITAATISAQYAVGAAGPQMPEMPAAASAAAAPAQTFAIGDTGGSSIGDSGNFGGISGVTEGFGSPGSVADVSGGQAPY